jgi:hypothetical protein
MPLHHHTHGGDKPASVLITAPPPPLQLEDVLNPALQRFYGIASWLVETLGLLLLEHLAHTLPFRAFVLPFSGRRQSEAGPLSRQLEQPRLIISLTVHENGGQQSFQLTPFQPQAFRLMATVAHPLAGP